MAILIQPKRWSMKPPLGVRINTGHPISQGLSSCVLFNEGGGLILNDSVSGLQGALSNSNGWGASPSPQGPALSFNGTSTVVRVASAAYDLSDKSFTIVAWGTPTATTSYALVSRGGGNTPANSGGWVFLTNAFRSKIVDTSDAYLRNNSVTAAANLPHMWAAAGNLVTSGTAQSVSLYTDGVLTNGSETDTQGMVTGSFTPMIGARSDSATPNGLTFFSGVISGVLVWNSRILTATDIQQLYVDPFCFLQPQSTQRRYYWAAAPTGTLFLPSQLNGLGSGGPFFHNPLG
jgi:hypothetical protein